MNEKKKLKGFTLIELIIVVAIFSIILALVMSFIDPVAKLMTKASTRERTAAYVDNIADYIENSIHYSRFIRVYNGGFCDSTDPNAAITESEAVKALVEEMLDNAVDSEGNSIKGRARVLKLINTPTSDCTEQGQIYESIYNFTTGVHIEDEVTHDITDIITPVNVSSTSSQNNKKVINDEHLQDYCYYYKTGFYNLNPLTDTDKYVDPDTSVKRFAAKTRSYYSRLEPLLYAKDPDGVVDDEFTMTHDETMCNFCVNVVSYLKGNRDTALDTNVDPAVAIPVFKSPANINSASMALVNVMQAQKSDEVICVWLQRKNDGSADLDENGNKQFIPKLSDQVRGSAYREFTATYDDSNDNIYIVYISPDEIYDTEIVYTK